MPVSAAIIVWIASEREPVIRAVLDAEARVLERCDTLLTPAGDVELDVSAREEVLRRNRELAARGLRVLALAEGRVDAVGADALQELTLVGLVGMSDPPAAGVRETIERFHVAGIRTVMITGDQRLTAEAVARELGILRPGDEIIEGRELQGLTPGEVADRLARVSALSRVSPEDKLRIVEALQRRGEIVAMLGDGVNDAPALKKADIGVAMGITGTDASKEAADIVLLVDDPARLVDAIEISRRTMRIARQSIGVGLGLSGVGMAIAALGYLTPVAGALVQEAIDVAVILNALRASRDVAGG